MHLGLISSSTTALISGLTSSSSFFTLFLALDSSFCGRFALTIGFTSSSESSPSETDFEFMRDVCLRRVRFSA